MSDFLFTVFTCVGLQLILMYGTILEKPRSFIASRSPFFKELISCSLCTGFWVGVILAVPFNLWFLPLFSAAICFIIDRLIDRISE